MLKPPEGCQTACKGFWLTAQEALQFLSQSREVSYQEWEMLPCQVSGWLRSELEPERDIEFTINVLGTALIREAGQSRRRCQTIRRRRAVGTSPLTPSPRRAGARGARERLKPGKPCDT